VDVKERGDADCSGETNLDDVLALLIELAEAGQGAAGVDCQTATGNDTADVNCDGTTDLDDLVAILLALGGFGMPDPAACA
jgi:hypothetical protein